MKAKIERLKEIREEKRLLQKDIAKILKITQEQYSLYERGERLIPIDKLTTLASFYNTSVDYLLCLTDERAPYNISVMQ